MVCELSTPHNGRHSLCSVQYLPLKSLIHFAVLFRPFCTTLAFVNIDEQLRLASVSLRPWLSIPACYRQSDSVPSKAQHNSSPFPSPFVHHMSENRQPPGGLFNAGPAPRYMPPTSNTMPANNSIGDQGLNGNSTSQAVPPNRNIAASNQATGHVTNSNPGTQYMPNVAVPGNLPMYNTSPSGTAPQAPPRPMAPNSNMPGGSHRPSQGVNRNGQGVHVTYSQIMNDSLLPMSSVRSNSHGIVGAVPPTPRQRFNAVPQTPGQRFNAVSTLRYTPSTNSIHRTNGAVGQARPIDQPQSPYDLPASQYAPYQSVHQRLGSQPTPPNNNNNRSTVNQTLTPRFMLPSGSVPSSATYPPAMNNDAKRPANAPPAEPSKKKQRKAAPPPVPLAQQPQQANTNPAVRDTRGPTAVIQTAETQLTTTQLASNQFAETKPGPPTVYLNTTAKYVIEPGKNSQAKVPCDVAPNRILHRCERSPARRYHRLGV